MIVKLGIGNNRKRNISFEIIYDDDKISNDVQAILDKWKNEFEKCSSGEKQTDLFDDDFLED